MRKCIELVCEYVNYEKMHKIKTKIMEKKRKNQIWSYGKNVVNWKINCEKMQGNQNLRYEKSVKLEWELGEQMQKLVWDLREAEIRRGNFQIIGFSYSLFPGDQLLSSIFSSAVRIRCPSFLPFLIELCGRLLTNGSFSVVKLMVI